MLRPSQVSIRKFNQRILPLTKDAVDDGEGHLEHAHEGLRGLQERPVRRHVAETYRGQGDEAEVQRGSEGPVLPGGEHEGAAEEEHEDDDQAHHDGDHHQVRGHVGLFADLAD